MEPRQDAPDLPDDRFIERRGKIVKDSATYAPELARIFWGIVRVVPSSDHRDDEVGAGTPV